MKSTIRFSTIAAAAALSVFGVSSAFSATYVPHEDNFGLTSSVVANPMMKTTVQADAHVMTSSHSTQTASAKTSTSIDNKSTPYRDIGSAM